MDDGRGEEVGESSIDDGGGWVTYTTTTQQEYKKRIVHTLFDNVYNVVYTTIALI